jgi:hypothetical protein
MLRIPAAMHRSLNLRIQIGPSHQELGLTNQESAISNQQSAIRNQESGIRNQESGMKGIVRDEGKVRNLVPWGTGDSPRRLGSGDSRSLWRRLVEVFTSTLYLLCVSVSFYFQY